jgi:hypothetical protein
MSSCKAVIHLNTGLADSLGAGKNNSKLLKAHYDQARARFARLLAVLHLSLPRSSLTRPP